VHEEQSFNSIFFEKAFIDKRPVFVYVASFTGLTWLLLCSTEVVSFMARTNHNEVTTNMVQGGGAGPFFILLHNLSYA